MDYVSVTYQNTSDNPKRSVSKRIIASMKRKKEQNHNIEFFML